MQQARIHPARRLERAIVVGLLAVWGVASVTTLAYQQSTHQVENARLPRTGSNTK